MVCASVFFLVSIFYGTAAKAKGIYHIFIKISKRISAQYLGKELDKDDFTEVSI